MTRNRSADLPEGDPFLAPFRNVTIAFRLRSPFRCVWRHSQSLARSGQRPPGALHSPGRGSHCSFCCRLAQRRRAHDTMPCTVNKLRVEEQAGPISPLSRPKVSMSIPGPPNSWAAPSPDIFFAPTCRSTRSRCVPRDQLVRVRKNLFIRKGSELGLCILLLKVSIRFSSCSWPFVDGYVLAPPRRTDSEINNSTVSSRWRGFALDQAGQSIDRAEIVNVQILVIHRDVKSALDK